MLEDNSSWKRILENIEEEISAPITNAIRRPTEPVQTPLQLLASTLRQMPYGDYMAFCEAVGANPEAVWTGLDKIAT